MRGQIRSMLAWSAIDLYCIESAMYEFAERSDAGEDIRHATARLKLFASEAAGRVADRVMQIHGGLGYTEEAEIERFYRDLRVMRIAEGPSEVMRMVIARQRPSTRISRGSSCTTRSASATSLGQRRTGRSTTLTPVPARPAPSEA